MSDKLFCLTQREARLLLEPPPSIGPRLTTQTDPESLEVMAKWREEWDVHDDVKDRLEGFLREE